MKIKNYGYRLEYIPTYPYSGYKNLPLTKEAFQKFYQEHDPYSFGWLMRHGEDKYKIKIEENNIVVMTLLNHTIKYFTLYDIDLDWFKHDED